MEKLIATCSLILLMVGLAFGGNFNKNNTSTESTPSVSEANSDINTLEEADINRYIFLPQNVDSLPVAEEVVDGIYKYEDNTQKAELTVKDNHVIALKVNDIQLKDYQFIQYKKLIDNVLRAKKPSDTPSVSNESFVQEGIKFDKNGFHLNSDKAKLDIDKNGFVLNGVDDNGNHFDMTIDENGLQQHNINGNVNVKRGKRDPYNTIRMKAENGYSYVVFDLNNEKIWKCYQSDRLLGDLVMKKDKKIYYNNKVSTSAQMLDFGLVYYNNALNPKTGSFQIITIEKRGEWNTDVRENNQGFSYSYSTDDDTEGLQEDIDALKDDVKELRKEIKECDCETNFDFRMGLLNDLDNLSPVYKTENRIVFNTYEKQFLSIKNRWERGNCDDVKQNNNSGQNNFNGAYFNNNGNQDLDARVKNISKKAKSLKDAIDDCACKSKDPNWVIWAKARLNAQYALAQNNKNDYGLKMIENEIATIEQQFNRLKNQSGTTNCEGCPPGNGQNYTNYSTSPNGYSYGTGASRADAAKAQREAEKRTHEAQMRNNDAQRRNQEAQNRAEESRQNADKNRAQRDSEDDDTGIAIHSFFQNLLDMGYISFNKQCVVVFTNTGLIVDGKNITGRDFQRILKDFDTTFSGKKKFNINYTGKIKGSNRNLSIQGSLNTSIF